MNTTYAYLPFVKLAADQSIALGPVTFSPENNITAISISLNVPPEKKESLFIDSLYLFYFAATFKELYHNTDIPHFKTFTKVLMANNRDKDPSSSQPSIVIDQLDSAIINALGKALNEIYTQKEPNPQILRLVRSIRFFVDSFLENFENLSEGTPLSHWFYDPEDTVFLSASFESLLDINEVHPVQDFKQKLRPMLHLNFSKPVEIFWKWVDGFYEIKKKIVKNGESPDQVFAENPNFRIPYLYLGVKLFIYTIYNQLHKHKLLDGNNDLDSTEVLLFLWPEENLLRKISLLMMEFEKSAHQEENAKELNTLSSLFAAINKHYFLNPQKHPHIQYIPCDKSILERYAQPIINYSQENAALHSLLNPDFLPLLKNRIA